MELRCQLPPSRGGMFYSVDVMDNVKQYYDANWSSLLLAAAIWLQDRGFNRKEDEEGEVNKDGRGGQSFASLPMPLLPGATSSSSSVTPSSGMSTPLSSSSSPSDPRLEKFHLILGLAVQSLCMPATLDQTHVLSNCLRTLRKLLCSEVAHEVLASDCRVGVELLSVVHRLLLTSTSLPIHVTSIQAASIMGGILQQAVVKASFSSPSSSSDPGVKGMGGGPNVPVKPEISIQPGESCAYGLLEVVACCLLRLIPSLHVMRSPHLTSSSASSSSSLHPNLKSEELLVILHSIKILGVVCSICGPEGVVSVLPPVLHMLLSTLAYVCMLQRAPTPGLIASLTSAGMQSLGQLCSALPLSHDLVGPQLCSIIQSALFSVLGKHVHQVGSVKGEEEEAGLMGMDDETRLVVVAVLLLRTPQDVCPAPSNLFDGCVCLFKQCLHSKDTKVCTS